MGPSETFFQTSWYPVGERTEDALTFDDVFLKPRPSSILPIEVDIRARLCGDITLATPFIAAPMDKVVDEKMAILVGLAGGIGILHRGMKEMELAEAVEHIKRFTACKISYPVTVSMHETIRDIRRLGTPYTGFPVVVEEGRKQKVVGIVTRRDMDGQAEDVRIADIMTPRARLITAGPDISSEDALALMRQFKIEKLPIVGENDDLLALITRKDLDCITRSPRASVDTLGRIRVGAAVSGAKEKRSYICALAQRLEELGLDVLVVDTAHGGSIHVVKTIQALKSKLRIPLIAGNVADAESARWLIDIGADALRVGIGSGSICTTRIITGVGVPQITAISECREAVEKSGRDVCIIADGGISEFGHVTKALAAGAHTVMIGNLFARTFEAPGEIVTRGGKDYKVYRGMGSESAIREYGGDRYFQTGEGKLVPEGVTATVPLRGHVNDLMTDMEGALRNGMGYVGAHSIPDLWRTPLVRVTNAGLREAHPHDLSSVEDSL